MSSSRRTQAVHDRIELIREGAGERFADIELQIVPEITLADTVESAADRAAIGHGWSGHDRSAVTDMPTMLLGPVEAIIEQILARREELGISYYVVADSALEAFAPVVKALGGP